MASLRVRAKGRRPTQSLPAQAKFVRKNVLYALCTLRPIPTGIFSHQVLYQLRGD